jgi:hypothetical protein
MVRSPALRAKGLAAGPAAVAATPSPFRAVEVCRTIKPNNEAGLPSRGGVTRPLTKEESSQNGAIVLHAGA